MGLSAQIKKIKENWLLLLVLIAILFFTNVGMPMSSIESFSSVSPAMDGGAYGEASLRYVESFAPDVEERKLVRSTHLTTEVEHGSFHLVQEKLHSIVASTNSLTLNENVNKYGSVGQEYYRGRYALRVEAQQYDSLLSQLKALGDVEYFSEQAQDVTGTYTNQEINLNVERQRLLRYQEMYDEAKEIEDRIELSDRIFSQERTIKYLEDALATSDERIDYVTVHFSLNERKSAFADIRFVKFSQLLGNFVGSINALLTVLFSLIPWAIVAGFGWFFWKKFFR